MNNKAVRIVALFLLGAAIAATITFLPRVNDYLFGFLASIRDLGVLGAVLLGLIYVLGCVLFVPGWILTVGAGYLYKLLWGTVIVSLASTLGATAAFLLGRTLLRDWVKRKVEARPRFRALDEAVGREGFKIVLLTRLSPVFPFNLLNYAYGVTNVRLRDFVLASWIGMLPGTVMYVYSGTVLQSLSSLARGEFGSPTAKHLLLAVGLVATIAVTVLITRIARNALRAAVPLECEGETEQKQREVPMTNG
jgi:uncharacterized membrane protein YdjX (TVP38/TMEM64 family)